MRILYVHSTLVPPPLDLSTDRFHLLSDCVDGDVLQPIWFQTPAEVEALYGPGSYPVYTVGKFRYHWLLSAPTRNLRQRIAGFWFYLRKGIEVHRERRFECIVAYSHMTTGLLAGVLKLLTRSKLVIEIATSPHLVYITESPNPGFRERFMKAYSDLCLHLSVFLADRIHFLYPGQLAHYPLLRKARNSVFHEFVPTSIIDRPSQEEIVEPYVLLVGAPWYLKGVDVLIEAFQSLASDFPDVKLKLMGYFPDREIIDALIGGSPQIEILRARPNAEALEIISRARVLVLPSRCEGMGRVLIEGMAAAVPVIGSDVGGIPSMIHHGHNGFLFTVGDSQALAVRLKQLLTDAGLRRRMGDCGYERAHTELNEQVYVQKFAAMVEAAIHGDQ